MLLFKLTRKAITDRYILFFQFYFFNFIFSILFFQFYFFFVMAKNARASQQPNKMAQKVPQKYVAKQDSPTPTKEMPTSVAWVDTIESKLSFSFSPFLVALAVNTLLFGVVYSLFKPEFNTGDDRAMMFLAAGKLIALEPTEYLIFTNIILGHFLKALYTSLPTVSWYPIYLVSGLFLGYTALLYSILKRRPSIISLVIYCSSFAVIGGFMLLELQFTMTATIVGFGGIALLLTRQNDGEQTIIQQIVMQLRSGAGIVGILLLVLSAMIRWQSFLLVIACTLPLIVIGLLFVASRRHSIAIVSLVILGSSFAVGAEMYHRYCYEHWGTFNYLEFNRLYGEFSDFKRIQRMPVTNDDITNIFKSSVNWSTNDFEMFNNEFYMDEKRYTIATMRTALEGWDKHEREVTKNPASPYYEMYKEFYKKIDATFWERLRALLLSNSIRTAVLFLFAIVLLSEIEVISMSALIATVGAVFVLLAYINYMTLMRDVAERVYYPLWVFVSLFALLCTKPRGVRATVKRTALVRNILSGVALCLCLYSLWYGKQNTMSYYSDITEGIRGGEERLRKTIATLQPKKENLYVIWAYGFPFRDMPPFCDLSVFNNFHALWLMWAQRTPTTKQLLDSYGVHDIYYDIPRRKNITFLISFNQISNPLLMYPQRYSAFIDEHFGTRVLIRNGSQRFITNTSDSAKDNPYTTFQTLELDTLTSQESEYYRQLDQQRVQKNQ
jgi:hypothetical protein